MSSRLSSVSRFSHGEYQDQPPRYERVESYPSLEKNGVEAPPLSMALYPKAAKASTMHKEDTDSTFANANWGHTLEL